MCKCYKQSNGTYLVYRNGQVKVFATCPSGCKEVTSNNHQKGAKPVVSEPC